MPVPNPFNRLAGKGVFCLKLITSEFMLTIFAWFLFITAGFVFIKGELNLQDVSTQETQYVSKANFDSTADLTMVDGSQIIGMVQAALNGNYALVLDRVWIDENTDISNVDLRGVVSNDYQITLYRQNGVISQVVATH